MASTLDKLDMGDIATVIFIDDNCKIKNRLIDIGIVPNSNIECLLNGYNQEIKAYLIKGAIIALRKEDAQKIIIC